MTDVTREYSVLGGSETLQGMPQSSEEAYDGSYRRRRIRSLSEQRTHAQHARHLPSRTLGRILSKVDGHNTIRIAAGGIQLPVEEHAEKIASHMELQEDLMQNDPISEMRRIETLREMAQSLTVKRSIRAKLAVTVERQSRTRSIGYWKRLKYAMSIAIMKIRITTKQVLFSVELWYDAIKTIEGQFGSGVATYFKFFRWLFIVNMISCLLSTCFVTVPQSLVGTRNDAEFRPWDIFIGNGYLENTVLYYGSYRNESITVNDRYTYNIPTAYFSTMICCYVLTFLILSIKVARSYRKVYIETAGGKHNLYASKIFCGWDFGIASYKAANLCSASICRELKELLAEPDKLVRPTLLKRLARLSHQGCTTILVIALMGAIGGSLWALLDQHETHESDPWSLLLVPFVITCIMNLFPSVVSLLVRMEHYSSKRTALYVTMIRVYTMTAIVIGTLLFYWLWYTNERCWQTDLAEEIYRLVIVDFVISILGHFIVEAIHCRLNGVFPQSVAAPKFEIAANTLNLIYNQILFWVAFYFSPPLSLIIILKMIMTFYIKKLGLLRHCEPASTPWRAAQTQTLFLALAFLALTAILVTLGYVITSVKSGDCGPFQSHDYTWDVVIDHVLNLRRDSDFWIVLSSLARPATGAAILVAMSMTAYWLRAKAESSKELVEILRNMLILQSRDRDFLLKEFSKVADENWLRRRNNFDLQRETSAVASERQIEMSKMTKRATRQSRAVGDTSNLGTPGSSASIESL